MSAAWDASHASARPWRSGAWTLELRDDELADLAYHNIVVLRAVRAVVRDRNWDTATTVVESIAEDEGSLELRVRSEGLGSSFTGIVQVTAEADELVVACDLRSAEAFETNRTGLVVLHPPTLADTALTVRHPAGEESSRFPEAISPHQPVRDIVGLAWHIDGFNVHVAFDGDVFEMEDQRNWTDASFKTYSRPLDWPFPYVITAGERIRQEIRITVGGGAITREPRTHVDLDRIALVPTGGDFPLIGLGAATAPDPGPAATGTASHLTVELDLASPTWRAALERAAASSIPLDVRFVVDPDRPKVLHTAVAALTGLLILRVTAFQPSGPAAHVSDSRAIDSLRNALRAEHIDAHVVGGVRSHFTQLNREHQRLPDSLDGIVFTITPLFHALSTEQLVESIAIQRLVAEQAVKIARGRPVHIGPVTLRPRLNDVTTRPQPQSSRFDLDEGYGPQLIQADDPRQVVAELGAWTVASAAALTVPGVHSLTYFEEWGPRGIRAASGLPYPVAEAINALRTIEGLAAHVGASSDDLVRAVGGRRGNHEVVLVANLDRRKRHVLIDLPSGEYRAALDPFSWGRVADRS